MGHLFIHQDVMPSETKKHHQPSGPRSASQAALAGGLFGVVDAT